MSDLQWRFDALAGAVAQLGCVTAIGKSGGAALPEPGESDIDWFVFCDEIPDVECRRAVYGTGVRSLDNRGEHWGVCDFLDVDGADVCLMYFTVDAVRAEITAVLDGQRLDKEGNYFYPVGRCATLLTMHALHDPSGFLCSMKRRLERYPEPLAARMAAHHTFALRDTEDLERAVSRRDALFYHFALDLALDHFLNALYALNRRYFPSRKRNLQHIESFARKPARCGERLLELVRLGGSPGTLPESFEQFQSLCDELTAMANHDT